MRRTATGTAARPAAPATVTSASSRAAMASWATLPEQSTTRCDRRRGRRRRSGRRAPPGTSRAVSSSTVERADFARSSDFGVKTMSGLRDVAAHLAAQQVEVLRGGRGVGHLDVVLGAADEEPLDAGRGVLGALALVAVRQQQHEAGGLAPLVLGGDEELVDDDLGAVDEVAELRLPDHQRLLVGDRVAVLEAERGVLRQQRVVDPELAPGRGRGWRAARSRPRSRCRRAPRGAGRTCPAGVSWPARRMSVPSSSSEPKANASPSAQSTSPSSRNIFVAGLELLGQLRVDGEAVGRRATGRRRCGRARRGRRRCRRGAARRRAAAAAWPHAALRRRRLTGSRRAPPAAASGSRRGPARPPRGEMSPRLTSASV